MKKPSRCDNQGELLFDFDALGDLKDLEKEDLAKMDVLALSRRIPLLGFFGATASDDDFADRLNYKYTVAILVVFAFIVTNKHFGHNQINCWVPGKTDIIH